MTNRKYELPTTLLKIPPLMTKGNSDMISVKRLESYDIQQQKLI